MKLLWNSKVLSILSSEVIISSFKNELNPNTFILKISWILSNKAKTINMNRNIIMFLVRPSLQASLTLNNIFLKFIFIRFENFFDGRITFCLLFSHCSSFASKCLWKVWVVIFCNYFHHSNLWDNNFWDSDMASSPYDLKQHCYISGSILLQTC